MKVSHHFFCILQNDCAKVSIKLKVPCELLNLGTDLTCKNRQKTKSIEEIYGNHQIDENCENKGTRANVLLLLSGINLAI